MNLTILYRGPLSSCNYACGYCPFAKRRETREELAEDERALRRFVDWAEAQHQFRLSVLFTPWGEALVRRWYQEALVRLTHAPQVEKAAVQTNLSCRLDWTGRCDKAKLGLWCTYHPAETTRGRFLRQCRDLDARGVRYSVGVVGLKEHLPEIDALRRELHPDVYLWVNAFKRSDGYYAADDIARLTSIDPLFPLNNTRHPSRGRPCRAGHTAVSVDGDGTVRRCHFIKAPIGNLYDPAFASALRPTPCTNDTCGCHIGYVHMNELGLYDVFGDGVLERIPASPTWKRLPLPVR